MKKKISLFVLPIIALILEFLPRGVMMVFVTQNGDPIVSYYPYFDLLPFGYAMWGPLITGVLTVFLIAMLIINLLIEKKWVIDFLKITSLIATIMSVTHFIFGLDRVTLISQFIFLCLLLEMLLIYIFYKNEVMIETNGANV